MMRSALRSRPLQTGELVEAAVLADVSVLLIVVGFFLPTSGLFWAAAVVPFAALVVRHRVRALVVGACSGCAVASLALGPGISFQVAGAALAGYVVGTSLRRGWGIFRTVALGLAVAWTSIAALSVAFLALFSSARKLTLDQAVVQWTGTKRFAHEALRAGDNVARGAQSSWALLAVGAEVLPVLCGVLLARSNRRIQRVILGIVLGAYAAACFALDVWTGILVVAMSAAGYIAARRAPSARVRPLTRRVWAIGAASTIALLAVGGRALFVGALQAQWRFDRRILDSGVRFATRIGDTTINWFVAHWWIAVPLSLLLPIVGITLAARAVAAPVLRRVERAVRRPSSPSTTAGDIGPAGPVPAVFECVDYVYPGAPVPALDAVTLEVPDGGYLGVLGDNGSGKSTLARLLAGMAPSSGRIVRPGSAAPGRRGGTAVIFQRPESQVLGVRVREDVVWGLADGRAVDVAGLLALVGLSGFEVRETSTLSGGELQRLAIAAALARDPALLVSDESTSMVDPRGRVEIVRLFADLAARGLTIVHITHRPEEVSDATALCVLARGRVVAFGPPREVLVGERA